MNTTVFLVRHGETDWTRERRLLGQRDLGLNADGLNQAHATAMALKAIEITEVISSPLLRAVQTAEVIGGVCDMEVARDPRLIEMALGRWEGMPYDAALVDPGYQTFMDDPEESPVPGGERLSDVRDRAAAAVHQALADNPSRSNVIVVTHASVIRVLLTHYLGLGLASFHRLRVSHGSLSVLRFADDRELPRILAVNHSPTWHLADE
ncbi:MAG: histidine phosphatase family protein [Deltaproteobacteria bacterium]|nr:histidine phosphatase family protein [Deltaproteobacteria bacterium]